MSQLWSKQPVSPSSNGGAARPTTPPSEASLEVVSPPSTGGRQRNPGRRFAQIIKLKPECVAKYKECHAAVWPEVARQIKACNIQDYSICHDPETGILFASFKYVGYDYAGDMERMRENPKGARVSMVPGAKSSEAGEPSWWKPVEEVFYQA
ncbi:hypothetical protein PG997_011040 [Apiospora hydei]|uniref:DUF718 domain protein n=1 Tax=Apiospora hydei TaxID=1337664 RepID=A0ABR1VIX0_9PEZI